MKLSKIALLTVATAAITMPASAATFTIDFETDLSQTPVDLDSGPTIDMISTATPLQADVAEDPDGALIIRVVNASSFAPTMSNVNASGAGFGINSPTPDGGSENASRFDVDAAESLVFTFSQDVNIFSVDLVSLTGDEAFTFGSVTGINSANSTSTVFTFADGGLFFSAGEEIFLEATGPAGSSVGLEAITLEVVPEPSSLALLGLGSLVVLRRRRA